MRDRGEDRRGLLERPGRLAAVGTAALVCVLSISGALGVSFTSDAARATPPPHTAKTAPDRGIVAPPTGSEVVKPPADTGGSVSQHGGTTTTRTPALPANSGEGKRIVFDMTAQRVWLVGPAGKVVRSYPVSGSKYHNLSAGSYTVSSKSRFATAYNSDETLNYMVRFAYGRTAPIGFHAIPVLPDGTLAEPRSGLGRPASDGCIRQWITDARALWNFAPVGTRVVVVA